MSFLDDRLGLDVTVYRKQTKDQIVNDIRGSYATGFILFNLNGAVDAQPGARDHACAARRFSANDFSWDLLGELREARGKVLALPNALARVVRLRHVALRQRAQRHAAGPLHDVAHRPLLPAQQGRAAADRSDDGTSAAIARRSSTRGYDRQPNFTIGLSNTFRVQALRARASCSTSARAATCSTPREHYLTQRGLSDAARSIARRRA